MKKLLLLFLCISFYGHAQTQMPNSDFEHWYQPEENFEFNAPVDWRPAINCVTVEGGEENCATYMDKSTDAQSGQYAMAYFNTESEDIHGDMAVSFSPYLNIADDFQFIPFIGRPTSVSFHYKYSTDDNQPMEITFLTVKGDLVDYDSVAVAVYNFSEPKSAYTEVNMDLEYVSDDDPSGIFFAISYPSNPTTAFDTLTMDNIRFHYDNGEEDEVGNGNGDEGEDQAENGEEGEDGDEGEDQTGNDEGGEGDEDEVTSVRDFESNHAFTAYVSERSIITSTEISDYSLLNLNGASVLNGTKGTKDISVARLTPGVYILKGWANGEFVSQKIIIL
ncbi:T9SS type A sorting domain-containing protein [Cytophagaceae bacterium ABcell3]|nr:T9SS type A sorting domain-containing protein [Cytophagaceae bacterium ABcell3]